MIIINEDICSNREEVTSGSNVALNQYIYAEIFFLVTCFKRVEECTWKLSPGEEQVNNFE